MIELWIVLGVLALLIVAWVLMYNGLVRGRNRVEESWAQIDVQLKRRHDLVPNLVETAKGYLDHERETLERVTQARQQAVERGDLDLEGRARAENQLTGALRQLFAVAEAYPDLKANQNMLALQEELTSTENKISFARQHYNASVRDFNTRIQQMPTMIVARLSGFMEQPYFEIEDPTEREVPQVEF